MGESHLRRAQGLRNKLGNFRPNTNRHLDEWCSAANQINAENVAGTLRKR